LSQVRVYITPFDENGVYGAEVEVTKYVSSIGPIGVDTDSSEYQIGVFRNSSVKLQLNNRDGLFSDVAIAQSIFRYTRADSKVRITYLEDDNLPYCGTAICGLAILCEEITVFQGLLSDDSFTEEAGTEVVDFLVLGYESLFSRVTVPFADISNGDDISTILHAILNQTEITDLLTVSLVNIVPSLDQGVEFVADLENKTGKEAIDRLLLLSNSVLYIQGTTVYVTARTATVATQQTFYGQASTNGAENIVNVRNITSGKNRIFNYMTWRDSSAVYQNSTSVRIHGVRKKELDSPLFTDAAKHLLILTEIVGEFGLPKQELELLVPINATTVERQLLDRVAIDYPTVYIPGEFDLPVCGIAVLGDPLTATLPRALWSLQIPADRRYKIIKKTLDFKSMVATFKLREI
jgi:hypothetical protein